MKRKALIIGCGISGPATALFLLRAGFDVEIYEARAHIDDYAGLFLNISSNGLNVLQELGLLEAVTAQGAPTPRMIMWSGNGKRLGEVRNGAQPGEGAESVIIKRGLLNQVLREEALRQGITISFGKKLTNVTTTNNHVTVTFADGTSSTADILIGCDGVHSNIRQILNPHAPQPSYTKLISTGGFSHTTSIAPTRDTQHFVFGKQAFFGYYVMPSGDVYWFNNFTHNREPERDEFKHMTNEQWKQRLSAMHSEDLPLINELIQSTTSDIGSYPIYDMPPQPTWSKGPVVLVGDAVHAVSPSAGQGASISLEDALILALCLRDISNVEQAFTTYERLRRERAEKIVKWSRRTGQTKTVSTPFSRWTRDLMMPFFLKIFANAQSLAWIYTYKIDWHQPTPKPTS